LKTQNAADVNPTGGLGVIKLGDYVELPYLTMNEYNGNWGGVNLPSNANDGKLQLMVVAINPYYNKNGNGTSTPHLIFHFKNIPWNVRMEATDTNQNGYAGSEMRKYLTPLDGVSGSGNFWTGLKNSGVPENVVWKISRRVTNKGGGQGTGMDTIEDYLWLPTHWEMFDGNYNSQGNYENSSNQGRFAYYDSKAKRAKSTDYWTASPCTSNGSEAQNFVIVWYGLSPGHHNSNNSSNGYIGCVPAFAVK
jgi:hypothetical protein